MATANIGDRYIDGIGVRTVVVDFQIVWRAVDGATSPEKGYDLFVSFRTHSPKMLTRQSWVPVGYDPDLEGEASRCRLSKDPERKFEQVVRKQFQRRSGAAYEAVIGYPAFRVMTATAPGQGSELLFTRG
jgi:hypothetical protein